MTEEQTSNNIRLQSESNMENENIILQEVGSGRPTESTNNDARFTPVDYDIIYNPVEGYSQNSETNNNENNPETANDGEKTENLNANKNNPSYNSNKKSFNLKIIVVGDISVGKTSVIKRYITNTFSEEHKSTISCEFKKKTFEIDAETCANLQIWDTAGEEKFMSVTKQFYTDSNGAMIVYDLTKKETFLKLNKWIKDVKETALKDVVIMIVGNKFDLVSEKVELGDELKPFKENYEYQDVSAKTGTNVALAFENLTNKIIKVLKEKKDKGGEEQRESLLLKKANLSKDDKTKKKCNC